jgi:DNA-binding NarL/FixJ family response regulator
VSAHEADIGRAGATIALELAIDDGELAERVRRLIARQKGLRLVDPDQGAAADIKITDSMPQYASAVPVIVLSDGFDAADALLAGVSVLSDHCDGETLYAASRAVLRGLTTFSTTFRAHLLNEAVGDDPPEDSHAAAVDLSVRERQVLELLAQGASNKMIARRLGITPHTAKFHVASILTKLGANGRTDAVARAMRLGMVMI